MKQTKMIVLVVTVLIFFSFLQYLPTVEGQGPESSLQRRVTELEALVESLTIRVAALEDGQAPPGTSFDVLHFNPLDEFPENPSNGDLCVVLTKWDWTPDDYAYHLYCYLNSVWFPTGIWCGAAGVTPPYPPPPTPPPTPLP